ncbi:MAG: hypothetical protein ACREA1_07990 [Nitrosotalea sp.]
MFYWYGKYFLTYTTDIRISKNHVLYPMSTYTDSYRKTRKRHDEYLPIGVALMIGCCLVTIFVISPQSGGYGGGTNQLALWEGAGVIWAGVLIGYIALIFRSV